MRIKAHRPWLTLDVPDNSTYLGEVYVGSSAIPRAGLLATMWEYDFKDESGNLTQYSGVWTYESCLPVYNIYQSVAQFLNTHTTFFNITIGNLFLLINHKTIDFICYI